MSDIGRFFSGHPARLAGALLTFAALSIIVWYLGSPLFVRTYSNEALPTGTASVATATAGAQPTAATTASDAPAVPHVLATGELGYVDAIHNGKGPVRLDDVGGRLFVRFEDVMLTLYLADSLTNEPLVISFLVRAGCVHAAVQPV